MKKLVFIFIAAALVLGLNSCEEDDKVTSSGEDLFAPMTNSEIDQKHREMFADYNTRVEYRYIKNLIPSDWFYITPAKEEKVLSMSEIVVDMWINPLVEASSKEFVGVTFPKLLVYIGSPAYQQDGSRVLGQAEGGTVIRFTEVNYLDRENTTWVNTQMHTAYHEYCHIVHQRYGLPNAYREVTPDSYVKSGWMTITSIEEALRKGMVTPYACSSVQEDFVELFATYIIVSDEELDYYFVDVEPNEGESLTPDQIMDNNGRAILREKLSIQKKYMDNVGLDMDIIRAAYQKLLPNEE
ncbi:MAG: putative zinc-binding metallopeptidase [Bacteroidales bacterium]|nr:putative zinc-binding metallopeptidase [Bacteroidales bacterium]